MLRGFNLIKQMPESKAVIGLNMLTLWKDRGTLEPWIAPLQEMLDDGTVSPVVAEAVPFDDAPAMRTGSSPSGATSARSCSSPCHRLTLAGTLVAVVRSALALRLLLLLPRWGSICAWRPLKPQTTEKEARATSRRGHDGTTT